MGQNEIVAADDADDVIMLLYHLLCHHQNQISDMFPLRMRETKCRSIKEALKEVNRKEHLQNNFSYICKIKLSLKKASSIRKIKFLRENLLCSLVFTIRR